MGLISQDFNRSDWGNLLQHISLKEQDPVGVLVGSRENLYVKIIKPKKEFRQIDLTEIIEISNEFIKSEKELLNSRKSDIAKILYLEVIDATFSIDGVVGAFAFTLSVPLILLGNGIGAFVVRQLTIGNIDRIRKYVYLKNGAMYSILVLGFIMLADSFSFHIPQWFSPIATALIVGYFFIKSRKALS